METTERKLINLGTTNNSIVRKKKKPKLRSITNKVTTVLLVTLMSMNLLGVNLKYNSNVVKADDLNNTVPVDENYTTSITTYNDGDQSISNDTYVNNQGKPTNVQQSTSPTSITTFAAGLPLSTIFIDTSKVGQYVVPKFRKLTTIPGIVTQSETNSQGETSFLVSYNPPTGVNTISGQPVEKGTIPAMGVFTIPGELYELTFEDAAILPDGSRADLKITYSNAVIAVDERLSDKDLGGSGSTAKKGLNSPYSGLIYLTRGSSFAYGGTDNRYVGTGANPASGTVDGGWARADRQAAGRLLGETVDDYSFVNPVTGETLNHTSSGTNDPQVGHILDATYRVVKNDVPVNGTFIFAMAGINLDRDPYQGQGNNYGKPLWYADSTNPEYHFFSESIAMRDDSIVSKNIYVRPNNGVEDTYATSGNADARSYFYPQVIKETKTVAGESVEYTRFVGNAKSNPDPTNANGSKQQGGSDDSYASGFVTLADAASGMTVTGYGHGNKTGTMNTQVFAAQPIWYRYTSSTGAHGSIQTTTEGNYNGKLNDGGDILGPSNPWSLSDLSDPKNYNRSTYVVAEGKTVTYTMTPDVGYKLSKIYIATAFNSEYVPTAYDDEILFDSEAVSKMKKGDSITVGTHDDSKWGGADTAKGQGTLTYEGNGVYTFVFNHATDHEGIHVEWEPTTADILTYKIWSDDDDLDAIRQAADANGELPKFKLQWSKNGRDWKDFEDENRNPITTMDIGIIYTLPTAVNQETVPSGEDPNNPGEYLDGTYVIDNGTAAKADKYAVKYNGTTTEYDTYAEAQTAALNGSSNYITQNTTDNTKYDYNGVTYNSLAEAQAAYMNDYDIDIWTVKGSPAHPFTWEYLPVYQYDKNGRAGTPIQYRIVELSDDVEKIGDPWHYEYKSPEYYSNQIFDLTSSKNNSVEGWGLYTDGINTYARKGDEEYDKGLLYPVDANGKVGSTPVSPQPDEANLTLIDDSNEYWTEDYAVAYHEIETKNKHYTSDIYVDVVKYWNDSIMKADPEDPADVDEYARKNINIILHGEIEGSTPGTTIPVPLDPNDDDGNNDIYDLIKTIALNEIDNKEAVTGYEEIDNYTVYEDVNNNKYAKVENYTTNDASPAAVQPSDPTETSRKTSDDQTIYVEGDVEYVKINDEYYEVITLTNGYYAVDNDAIDYASGPVSPEPTELTPVKKNKDGTYRIDDDRFGAMFEWLPTHYNGKHIIYTVTETDTQGNALESWILTGGQLSPVYENSNVIGYETVMTNTPDVDEIYTPVPITILKVDKNSGAPLEGAVFTVYFDPDVQDGEATESGVLYVGKTIYNEIRQYVKDKNNIYYEVIDGKISSLPANPQPAAADLEETSNKINNQTIYQSSKDYVIQKIEITTAEYNELTLEQKKEYSPMYTDGESSITKDEYNALDDEGKNSYAANGEYENKSLPTDIIDQTTYDGLIQKGKNNYESETVYDLNGSVPLETITQDEYDALSADEKANYTARTIYVNKNDDTDIIDETTYNGLTQYGKEDYIARYENINDSSVINQTEYDALTDKGKNDYDVESYYDYLYFEVINDTVSSTPASPQPSNVNLTENGKLKEEEAWTDGTNIYVKRENKFYLVDDEGNVSSTASEPDLNITRLAKDLKTGDVIKNTVKTDEMGYATITFLVPNDDKQRTYTIVETEAPEGYAPDTTPYVFTIKDDLKTITLKVQDDSHTTSWWEKLYELIFGPTGKNYDNWKPDLDKRGGTLTVEDSPITADILVRKYWNDKDNQDGKRPGDPDNPTSTTDPNLPQVTLQYTIGAHTAEGSVVYTDGEKKYVHKPADDKYHEVIEEDVIGQYQYSAANPQPETATISASGEKCNGLDVYEKDDVKYVIIDNVYHELKKDSDNNYIVDKVGEVKNTPATTQPDPNVLTLVMDGDWVNAYDENNAFNIISQSYDKPSVSYVGGPVLTHQNDAYTWTDLPAYINGKVVTYRILETGDILDNTKPIYAYDIESNHTSQTHEKVFNLVDNSGSVPKGLNQTVDITNKHEPQVVNIEVYKKWEDEDKDDRSTAKLYLYKVVEGIEYPVTAIGESGIYEDIGQVPVEIEKDESTGEPKAIKVWKDLPTYEGGKPVTYRLKEEKIEGYITIYEAKYKNTAERDVKEETTDIVAEDIYRTYYEQGDTLPKGKDVYEGKYVNNTDTSDIITEEAYNALSDDAKASYHLAYINKSDSTDIIDVSAYYKLPDVSKKVGNEKTAAKFEILNERSVNIKVEKTWVNGANASVTFELWRTITPESDLDESKYTKTDVDASDPNVYYVRKTMILTPSEYEALSAEEKANYSRKYVNNTNPNDMLTPDRWNKLDNPDQLKYEKKYQNNIDQSEFITVDQFSALSPIGKNSYTLRIYDGEGSISESDYEALTPKGKNSYTATGDYEDNNGNIIDQTAYYALDPTDQENYSPRYADREDSSIIISETAYNELTLKGKNDYTRDYVNNNDSSIVISEETYDGLSQKGQNEYTLKYVNKTDVSDVKTEEEWQAIPNTEQAKYTESYVDDSHKIVSKEEYATMTDEEKAEYNIEQTTSWSPYAGGGKEASIYVNKTDPTDEITKEAYDALGSDAKNNYEPKIVDGWELVASHEFDGNSFINPSPNGDKKSYTFNDLLIKDEDGHKYTYRVLEKPELVRFRENQISDTQVIDNNVNVSDGNVALEVVKEVENRKWLDGDQFYFYLEPIKGVDVTDSTSPKDISADKVPMPYRIENGKTNYNYTADATDDDPTVGAIGRAATFKSIQYKENSSLYHSIDRGDIVEFYYKVYEISDTKKVTSTNGDTTVTVDTTINDETKHSGYLDGITYTGEVSKITETEYNNLEQYGKDSYRLVVVYVNNNDSTDVISEKAYADLSSEDKADYTAETRYVRIDDSTKIIKVSDYEALPDYGKNNYSKVYVNKDNNKDVKTTTEWAAMTDADEKAKYEESYQAFLPTVHYAKVIVKNVDGIITTETQWLKEDSEGNKEYKTGFVPVYTNTYSSEGYAKAWIEKRISNRTWEDFDNAKKTGDAFTYLIESISGAQLNVPGATSDSYTSRPLMSNSWNNPQSGINPQTDIQQMSDTEYAFGLRGNKYDNTMLNSEGYAYFIYEISETPTVNYRDANFNMYDYTVDGLEYDTNKIYARLKAQDNWDGTISFTINYFTDASCKNEYLIRDHKAWIYDDGTESETGKYLLTKAEAEAAAEMTDEQLEQNKYRQINVAYFTNYESVDIPVKKQWVDGPAVEDVNLHLEVHKFDLSTISETDLDRDVDAFVKDKENHWKSQHEGSLEGFWETAGYTHVSHRGEFLNNDGTPEYDEGSDNTSSNTYVDIDGFNLNLPKYEHDGDKTYRLVYRLYEDDTSNTYETSYKSLRNVVIDNTAYQQLSDEEKEKYSEKYVNNDNSKDIITEDEYDALTNKGKNSYTLEYENNNDNTDIIIPSEYNALTPLGKNSYTAEYVNNNVSTDIIDQTTYDSLPDYGKDNYVGKFVNNTDTTDIITEEDFDALTTEEKEEYHHAYVNSNDSTDIIEDSAYASWSQYGKNDYTVRYKNNNDSSVIIPEEEYNVLTEKGKNDYTAKYVNNTDSSDVITEATYNTLTPKGKNNYSKKWVGEIESDKEDYIFTDGDTLVVVNEVKAFNTAKPAAVKQLLNRNWLDSDDFIFILTPIGMATYDDKGDIVVSGDEVVYDDEVGTDIPMPTADNDYANIYDDTNFISKDAYDALDTKGKDSYDKVIVYDLIGSDPRVTISQAQYSALDEAQKANYTARNTYVNKKDSGDVIDQTAYNALKDISKDSYKAVAVKEYVNIDNKNDTITPSEYNDLPEKGQKGYKRVTVYDLIGSDPRVTISQDEYDQLDDTEKVNYTPRTTYVSKKDSSDVIDQATYDALDPIGKNSYNPVRVYDEAHAKNDDNTIVDPNGRLERLARFNEISFYTNDLVYNEADKHYHGDFFYEMKEDIPEGVYAVNKTSLEKVDGITLTDENRGDYYWKDPNTGIIYDGRVHTVHIKVKENRTDELQVQIAYDEETPGTISSGTQFTPVYTNRYDSSLIIAQEVDKYIMGRNFEVGDVFDFRMTAMSGAPFEDGDPNEFHADDTEHDSATYTDAQRNEYLAQGKAVHSARGAHVKRLTVTSETVNDEVQKLTMPELKFELSDLNKIAANENTLKYSDGSYVAKGMAYDQFIYSFEETNDYLEKAGNEVEDLNVDGDTEYIRITIIDKGDGTLDYYTEVFEDRYCTTPRVKPNTYVETTPVENPKAEGLYEKDSSDNYKLTNDQTIVTGKKYYKAVPAINPTFVNQLKRELSITKTWTSTATSDVTLRLQWSVNGTNWYDVDDAEWLPASVRSTQTIQKDAYGSALTKTWYNLPAYANINSEVDQRSDDKALNDLWVYYRIVEDNIKYVETRYSYEKYELGDSYTNTEKYKTKEALDSPHTESEKETRYSEVDYTLADNPQAKGWYEYDGENYVKSTDTVVDTEKQYFTPYDAYPTKRITQLYVTNWPVDVTGEANVGVVKQFIGKEWADEKFTFLITPIESMIGSEDTPIKEGAKRNTGNYVKKSDDTVISGAEYEAIIAEDPSKADDYKPEEKTNNMPAYGTNKDQAVADKSTNEVSVNEHAADFYPLTIKLSDLAVDYSGSTNPKDSDYNPNYGKAVGTFFYKVYEKIDGDAVSVELTDAEKEEARKSAGEVTDYKWIYNNQDYDTEEEAQDAADLDGASYDEIITPQQQYDAAVAEALSKATYKAINNIKYTTEEHIVKIVAVDDGGGDIDITVSYDDREHGQYVPVYTNYAMLPTPITGEKKWIGGEETEHINGTVTTDDNDNMKVIDSTDLLQLQLQRKDSQGNIESITKDDVGRDLVIVWAKVETKEQEGSDFETYVYSEDGQNPVVPERKANATALDFENQDEICDGNNTGCWIGADHVKEEVDVLTKYENGNGWYTIYAVDEDGNYVQPILDKVEKDGNEYIYSIKENADLDGYDDPIYDSEKLLNVTNMNNEESSIKVTKTWDDQNNAEGIRPEQVIVHLYKVLQEVELSDEERQQAIASVDMSDWIDENPEPVIDDYTSQDEFDIAHAAWVDDRDAEQADRENTAIIDALNTKRANVTPVQVEVDKKIITKQSGDSDNKWSTGITWENLEVYDETGKKITYVVVEESVTGYDATYSVDSSQYLPEGDYRLDVTLVEGSKTIDVKNSLTPATTRVPVKKVWSDDDDVDNKRPETVEITLYERVWDNNQYGSEKEATYADGTKIAKLVLNGEVDTLTNNKPDVRELAPSDYNIWNGEFTNLPATKNGKTVIYYVKETTVTNYDTPVITGNQLDGYTVTNSRSQDTTEATITKVWFDYNNRLNVRPDTLTMELWRSWLDENNAPNKENVTVDINGYAIKTLMSEDDKTDTNTWKFEGKEDVKDNTFGNLPENIVVNVIEKDYEAADTSSIENPNEAGLYEKVNNVFVVTSDTEVDSDKTYYQGTNKVAYVEATPEINPKDEGFYEKDGDNYVSTLDGERQPGKIYYKQEVVTHKESREYTYYWKETIPNGYTATVNPSDDPNRNHTVGETEIKAKNGATITNTIKVGQVIVTKTWDDGDESGQYREAAIDQYKDNLKLYAETADGTVLVDVNPDWDETQTDKTIATYENLPIFDGTKQIEYSIDEGIIDNYSMVTPATISTKIIVDTETGKAEGNIAITNKHTTTFSFTKQWFDENGNTIRHDTNEYKKWISLWRKIDSETQYASNVTETYKNNLIVEDIGDNKYRIQWSDLAPSDPSGNAYTYVAKETLPENSYYEATIEGDINSYIAPADEPLTTGIIADGKTITNKQIYKDIVVRKVWIDNIYDATTGKDIVNPLRPEIISLTLADVSVGGYTRTDDVVVESENDPITYTFKKMPVYKADGTKMEYELSEADIPNYVIRYTDDQQGVKTVINTYMITKFTGTKEWIDGSLPHDNAQEVTPKLRLYQLTKNADNEYIAKDDVPLTNNHNNYKDVHVDWNGNNFTIYNLPVGDEDGNSYEYWVEEVQITDYQAPIYSEEVVNDTITIVGEYNPDLAVDQPTSVTDTQETCDGKTVVVDGNENKYVEISGQYHAVTKVDEEVKRNGIGNGGKITNKIANESVTISGEKIWIDPVNDPDVEITHNNNSEQVQLEVYQVLGTAETKLTENTHYTLTWNGNTYTVESKDENNTIGMPLYDEDGNEYTYYVKEVSTNVKDANNKTQTYDKTHSDGDHANDDGTITNRNEILKEKVGIEATKIWSKDTEHTDERTEVTFVLYSSADNWTTKVKVAEKTVPVPNPSTETSVTVTFDDQPKYDYDWDKATGTRTVIQYAIEEKAVPNGYTLKRVTRLPNTTTGGKTTYKWEVENEYDNALTYYTVRKVWDDNNNQDGLRPASITVTLTGKVGDDTVSTQDHVLNSDNNWKYTFTELPVRREADGKKITYTIDETTVPAGYTKTVEGPVVNNVDTHSVTITNKETPDTVNVKVTKVWAGEIDDNGTPEDPSDDVYIVDPSETRSDVKLHLYGYYSTQASGVNPSQDNKNKLAYVSDTVYTISKSATGEELTVEWKNLPKKLNGTELTYVVYEEAIPGYRTEVKKVEGGNDKTGPFEVVNTYYGPVTTVMAKKVWDDTNNIDRKRPNSVEFQLYRSVGGGAKETVGDPVTVDTFTNNESEYVTWDNLPTSVYVGTEEKDVLYSVEEVISSALTGAGYSTIVESTGPGLFTVRNTKAQETKDIIVKKVWVDSDNAEGLRPDHITVKLLADDSEAGEAVLAGPTDSWTYTFENLPVNREGKDEPIVYTIEEVDEIDKYETTVVGPDESGTVTITNTLTGIEKIIVKVKKLWVNDEGHEDLRKDVTVTLYADDSAIRVGTIKLDGTQEGLDTTDSDGYHVWNNLPKYKEVVDDKGTPDDPSDDEVVQVEIKYDVKEKDVENYVGFISREVNGHTYVFDVENVYEDKSKVLVTYIDPKASENNMILGLPKEYDTKSEAQAASKDPAHTPSDPAYDGYEFVGWASNFDPQVGFIMVATYKPIETTLVTYIDPYAADPIIKSQYAKDPSSITDPSDPSHTGLVFDKWVEVVDEAGNVSRVATYKCVCSDTKPCPIDPGRYTPPRTGIRLSLASVLAIITGVGVIISAGIKR